VTNGDVTSYVAGPTVGVSSHTTQPAR
jgi:hypothetical protein